MKLLTIATFVLITLQGCEMNQEKEKSVAENPMVGTWELVTGTTIQGKDTTTIDYTKGKKFLKIINSTNFAFVGHDLSKGRILPPFILRVQEPIHCLTVCTPSIYYFAATEPGRAMILFLLWRSEMIC
ncbi:MAG: hypothetical protein WDM78_20525 [Puia sp.]